MLLVFLFLLATSEMRYVICAKITRVFNALFALTPEAGLRKRNVFNLPVTGDLVFSFNAYLDNKGSELVLKEI